MSVAIHSSYYGRQYNSFLLDHLVDSIKSKLIILTQKKIDITKSSKIQFVFNAKDAYFAISEDVDDEFISYDVVVLKFEVNQTQYFIILPKENIDLLEMFKSIQYLLNQCQGFNDLCFIDLVFLFVVHCPNFLKQANHELISKFSTVYDHIKSDQVEKKTYTILSEIAKSFIQSVERTSKEIEFIPTQAIVFNLWKKHRKYTSIFRLFYLISAFFYKEDIHVELFQAQYQVDKILTTECCKIINPRHFIYKSILVIAFGSNPFNDPLSFPQTLDDDHYFIYSLMNTIPNYYFTRFFTNFHPAKTLFPSQISSVLKALQSKEYSFQSICDELEGKVVPEKIHDMLIVGFNYQKYVNYFYRIYQIANERLPTFKRFMEIAYISDAKQYCDNCIDTMKFSEAVLEWMHYQDDLPWFVINEIVQDLTQDICAASSLKENLLTLIGFTPISMFKDLKPTSSVSIDGNSVFSEFKKQVEEYQ